MTRCVTRGWHLLFPLFFNTFLGSPQKDHGRGSMCWTRAVSSNASQGCQEELSCRLRLGGSQVVNRVDGTVFSGTGLAAATVCTHLGRALLTASSKESFLLGASIPSSPAPGGTSRGAALDGAAAGTAPGCAGFRLRGARCLLFCRVVLALSPVQQIFRSILGKP